MPCKLLPVANKLFCLYLYFTVNCIYEYTHLQANKNKKILFTRFDLGRNTIGMVKSEIVKRQYYDTRKLRFVALYR